MGKYARIKNGELLISNTMLRGYKPLKYEDIPEDFDQTTHYVTQSDAEDKGDYIYAGIEIHELDVDEDDEEMEDE